MPCRDAVRERAAAGTLLRYYRALYSQLFRKEAGSSAKAAMFLNLLFKVRRGTPSE